jgi:hypothetical protein
MGEKKKRMSKKNMDGKSTSSHDSKKFRIRSVEKQWKSLPLPPLSLHCAISDAQDSSSESCGSSQKGVQDPSAERVSWLKVDQGKTTCHDCFD